MPGLGEGTEPRPELASLSGLCLPLSQHQSQEMQRRSPRSLGLWVREFPTARETRSPEVGVEWGGTLVGQTAGPGLWPTGGGRMGGLPRCPCFRLPTQVPLGSSGRSPCPPGPGWRLSCLQAWEGPPASSRWGRGVCRQAREEGAGSPGRLSRSQAAPARSWREQDYEGSLPSDPCELSVVVCAPVRSVRTTATPCVGVDLDLNRYVFEYMLLSAVVNLCMCKCTV